MRSDTPQFGDVQARSANVQNLSASCAPAKTLSPELKAWLDNVIIPALVQRYLSNANIGDNTQEPVQ